MSGVAGRVLGHLVSGIVLAVSGTYLLVYLYRWEWNRAVVAGVFFVAAEVAIAAGAILRRLAAIEQRINTGVPTIDRIREARPEPRRTFAWLDERVTSTNVFVPVLLGAGVVLTLLATAVERLAAASALPVLEHRLAASLRPLALPPGGLLGSAPPRISRIEVERPPRPLHRLAVRAFAVAAAVLLLVSAIDVIADATQDRPDPPVDGSAAVTIQVARRSTGRSPVLTAEALVVACRHTVGDQMTVDLVREATPGVVTVVVSPAFGEHAQRRLVGCLEDATFDRVAARVLAVEQVGRSS